MKISWVQWIVSYKKSYWSILKVLNIRFTSKVIKIWVSDSWSTHPQLFLFFVFYQNIFTIILVKQYSCFWWKGTLVFFFKWSRKWATGIHNKRVLWKYNNTTTLNYFVKFMYRWWQHICSFHGTCLLVKIKLKKNNNYTPVSIVRFIGIIIIFKNWSFMLW